MPKMSLQKIEVSDKKYFAKWWRDVDLLKLTSGNTKQISIREVDKYFYKMMRSRADMHYMICLGKQKIGHISLVKRAFGWYETMIVIGEKRYWNKGFGTSAIELLKQIAECDGVKKIYLEARPENQRAIRTYEKCGFVKVKAVKHRSKFLPETWRMELSNLQPQEGENVL